MRTRICAQVAIALALSAGADGAFLVDDRSFFSGKDHIFLDFESRGDGTPLNLLPDDVIQIPPDEYGAVGLRLATPFVWGHVGAPPSKNPNTIGGQPEALDTAGSWPTFAVGFGDSWTIEFKTPVRAFGVGVVQLDFTNFGGPPAEEFTSTITAFNAAGDAMGVVTLWTDTVDGGFGGPYAGGLYGDEWSVFNYGFLGLVTSEPIATLEFTNIRQSIIDDLHFSAVPAPGAGAAFALLGLSALTRRRR